MEILFAIKSIDNGGGGAERVLAEVTSGLVERGHGVSILTYDSPDGNSFYTLHPSVKRVYLRVGSSQWRSTAWETIRRVVSLRKLITHVNPEIVVGFMHSMFIPLGLALAGTKYPLVASEHIGVEYYRFHPIEHLLLQLTPYLTKHTTVISENLRVGYNSHIRKNMTVIPNPVSSPKLNLSDRSSLNGERKTILSIGRLVMQKDHKTLIEAFSALTEKFPDWDLRIVGDGELRPQLEAQVNALGLHRRIQLANITQNIEEEYLNAQIFAMPSIFESFGLVTAEALTYGVPAIGFADCSGTNELIKQDHNGILVQGSSRAAALAEGLSSLMNSPELRKRLGSAGPDSMAEYSTDKICDKWENLLLS